MLPVFVEKCQQLCEFWIRNLADCAGKDGRGKLRVAEDMTWLTLDVIGKCAMGYDFNSLENPDHSEVNSFREIIKCMGLGWDLLLPFWEKWPTKRMHTFKKFTKLSDAIVSKIIREKEEKYAANTLGSSDVEEDLLSMLMSAHDDGTGKGLTDKELSDHVLTFVMAGHETTSHGLTWLLLHLAKNPCIQDKLREEILEYLPDETTPVTMETIDKMEYLNAVVKETLRYTPPVPLVTRENLEDDFICGQFVPAGTVIHLDVFGLMRQPEYFEDPETFKPKRFLTNKDMNPYIWLPFVLGSRMCIGYRFALLEMKAITALLVKGFKFSWVPGYSYRPKLTVTMRPDPPLELMVEKIG